MKVAKNTNLLQIASSKRNMAVLGMSVTLLYKHGVDDSIGKSDVRDHGKTIDNGAYSYP